MVSYEETPKGVKIVGASSTSEGIAAEYAYVARELGVRGRDWELVVQKLVHDDGVDIDELDVKLANGEERTFRFDITDFFGIEVRTGALRPPATKAKGCLGLLLVPMLVGLLAALRG